jgi:hypothetical protein
MYKLWTSQYKHRQTEEHFEPDHYYGWSEIVKAVVMKSSVFWDITPCSRFNVERHFRRIYRFHLVGRRISHARNEHEAVSEHDGFSLAYSLTLKMDSSYSSETSVDFQRTTRCYIPEDRTFLILISSLRYTFILIIHQLIEQVISAVTLRYLHKAKK